MKNKKFKNSLKVNIKWSIFVFQMFDKTNFIYKLNKKLSNWTISLFLSFFLYVCTCSFAIISFDSFLSNLFKTSALQFCLPNTFHWTSHMTNLLILLSFLQWQIENSSKRIDYFFPVVTFTNFRALLFVLKF